MNFKKKLLVIGGTGFLGFHLIKKCIAKGWIITSVSTTKPKKKKRIKNVNYITLDITKNSMISKKIKGKYDFVVNFGGYVNHNEKRKTYDSHYIGCKNLVNFFLKKNIKKFVQVGSSVEYGSTKSPQKENVFLDTKFLKSTYGKAKLLATRNLLFHHKKSNFPCIIIRPYLVYGPMQDFNRFIPLIIKGCLTNSKFPCSNGNQVRNFLYVDDFVDGVLMCLKNNTTGEIFNIGHSKSIRIKDIIIKIKKMIKKGQPDFGKVKIRKDEIIKLYPNIDKIKKTINWKPKVSFNSGLKKTIKYYKKIL